MAAGFGGTVGKMIRYAGLAALVLYLAGWIIALVGLGLGQNWCKDHMSLFPPLLASNPTALLYTLLAREPGDNCRKLYRFPWLIWALSTLPVLLMIAHLIKPRLVRLTSGGLYAVLAVFQIFATDTFLNLTESVVADQFDDVVRGNKIRVTGFAIMAACSLLMLLLDTVHFGGESHHAHHGSASDSGNSSPKRAVDGGRARNAHGGVGAHPAVAGGRVHHDHGVAGAHPAVVVNRV